MNLRWYLQLSCWFSICSLVRKTSHRAPVICRDRTFLPGQTWTCGNPIHKNKKPITIIGDSGVWEEVAGHPFVEIIWENYAVSTDKAICCKTHLQCGGQHQRVCRFSATLFRRWPKSLYEVAGEAVVSWQIDICWRKFGDVHERKAKKVMWPEPSWVLKLPLVFPSRSRDKNSFTALGPSLTRLCESIQKIYRGNMKWEGLLRLVLTTDSIRYDFKNAKSC